MSDEVMFSIIVPIYNGEEYIENAVNSVVNQSFTNFEIILVNDGSGDNTLNICEKLSKQYDNISVINKENSGVSDSRNVGIQKARGIYLIFLDCDDYLPVDTLKIYSENIEKYDYPDLLQGNSFDKYGEKLSIIYDMEDMVINDRHSFLQTAVDFKYVLKCKYGNLHSICTKAISRKKVMENNIRFNNKLRIGEDFDFFANCVLDFDSVVVFKECAYVYNQNPDSVMHNIKWEGFEHGRTFFHAIESALAKHKIECDLTHFFFEVEERSWMALMESELAFKEKYKILKEAIRTEMYQKYGTGSCTERKLLKVYRLAIKNKLTLLLMMTLYLKIIKAKKK